MKTYFKITNHETIRDILLSSVKEFSQRCAFILRKGSGYERISFERLGREARCLGANLLARGWQGHHVAILGANSYEWVLSFLAVVQGLGTAVPLDKGLTKEELMLFFGMGDVDAIICDREFLGYVDEYMADNRKLAVICMDEIPELCKSAEEDMPARYDALEVRSEDTALIVFTSGTTSTSKAVVLSHGNIASNVNGLNEHESFGPDEVNFAFLPFHHVFGLTGQLYFINVGASSAFCDGLRHIAKNLAEYKVTSFFCVPAIIEAMHKRIIKRAEESGKLETMRKAQKIARFLLKFGIDVRRKLFKDIHAALGGSLRTLISGAAPLSPDIAQDLNDFGILTIQGYGLTETSPTIASESIRKRRPGSIGTAMANTEVRIYEPDEQGIGELIVRGPGVMQGYYKNPEASTEVMRNGWLHTGDYARIDEDGFIFISGRKKNVIVLKNGKKVFPEELEALIAQLPYAVESIIWGCGDLSDPDIALKLVYDRAELAKHHALPENADAKEVAAHIWKDIKEINEKTSRFKHISYLTVSEEPMEKTTSAKIRRAQEIAKIPEEDLVHVSQGK